MSELNNSLTHNSLDKSDPLQSPFVVDEARGRLFTHAFTHSSCSWFSKHRPGPTSDVRHSHLILIE